MANKKEWRDLSLKEKIISGAVLAVIVLSIVTVLSSLGGGNSSSQNVANLTGSEKLEQAVRKQLEGKNDEGKDYLRNVRVNELGNDEYSVYAEFNADPEFTPEARKIYIEERMSDIYIALYTSDENVSSAGVGAFLTLTDQYGNEKDGLVYKSTLDAPTASKINFYTDDKQALRTTILPGLWTKTNVHKELE